MEMISIEKSMMGMKKKSIVLICLHVYSALLICFGTLVCYLLLIDASLILAHKWLILLQFFVGFFIISVGLKLYRGASDR